MASPCQPLSDPFDAKWSIHAGVVDGLACLPVFASQRDAGSEQLSVAWKAAKAQRHDATIRLLSLAERNFRFLNDASGHSKPEKARHTKGSVHATPQSCTCLSCATSSCPGQLSCWAHGRREIFVCLAVSAHGLYAASLLACIIFLSCLRGADASILVCPSFNNFLTILHVWFFTWHRRDLAWDLAFAKG